MESNENDASVEKSSIFIIDGEGKVSHTDEGNSKSFMEKLNQLERSHSSDSEDHSIKVSETQDDAPVHQRKLFGPPSWNAEQLATAIKAVVQDGISLTTAARDNGIPRTTLANKIYGRKRRRTNDTSATVTSTAYPAATYRNSPASHEANLSSVVGNENEKLLADFLTRQRHVDSYSMTRAVFDLAKYFTREKGVVVSDDEEVKEWLRCFFLKYPTARFTVWNSESGRMESTEESHSFVDFIFETCKKEIAEEVKRKLFTFVKKKAFLNIHLFWWYTFLVKNARVKSYFMEFLKWPNCIMDGCHMEYPEDEMIHNALTNILLNRMPVTSHQSSQRLKMLVSDVKSEASPTQVNPRRTYDMSYQRLGEQKTHRSSREYVTGSDDTAESHDSNNISSTSTRSSSFGIMIAQEGLQAVERKLSAEDVRYFLHRYENPQLEEAFQVWKNLKMAVDKKDNDNDSTFA
ncbi:uncharacterized protein LOC130647539 [Hydractinia symbiolongicarpus]|uniref:uncharacterized protein LOC130647539 n=1 Tax=Hydractinia symbiolongicarpus TaxID=13093 RepID=UPI00254F68F6|nr:uncharacterized protein LOC130647539 [Hydractinia symbiolongicarpus]